MEETSTTSRHERNAALRHEYTATEKLLAEVTASDIEPRKARRIERRLERIAAEFVQLNGGLAGNSARTFTHSGTQDGEDYLSSAMMGLWEAFLQWDPEQATFGTFSRVYIDGSVKRAVRSCEAPEISYGDFTARPKIKQAAQVVKDAGGDETDAAAVAAEAGLSEQMVERATRARPTSLDAPVGEDTTVGDSVADESSYGTEQAELSRSDIESALSELTPVELWVILRRDGIDGWPGQTYVNMVRELGLGRQSIQRAAYRAEAKIEAARSTEPATA